jgi:hypothetical protein
MIFAICPIGPLLIRPTLNFPLEVLSLMNFMVILEEELISKVLNIKSNSDIVLIVWKPVVNIILEVKHVKDLISMGFVSVHYHYINYSTDYSLLYCIFSTFLMV